MKKQTDSIYQILNQHFTPEDLDKNEPFFKALYLAFQSWKNSGGALPNGEKFCPEGAEKLLGFCYGK
ncbi:MAG: hypothetical protein NT129_00895 [Candidatus Aenigmarchaeota archaeon]|nr:hypothetical protein [Candidatus Aenigmarchaeota archaeon]